ncbi:MAG TPA: hypothetical protein VFN31_00070 [Candidatus Saccharimonadales bacterium]|nr:hypothetical protein [Candidatus Saccharimonadales bacterium]
MANNKETPLTPNYIKRRLVAAGLVASILAGSGSLVALGDSPKLLRSPITDTQARELPRTQYVAKEGDTIGGIIAKVNPGEIVNNPELVQLEGVVEGEHPQYGDAIDPKEKLQIPNIAQGEAEGVIK